jgi:hypothetical protein
VDNINNITTCHLPEYDIQITKQCSLDTFKENGIYKYKCQHLYEIENAQKQNTDWEKMILEMYGDWEVGTIIKISSKPNRLLRYIKVKMQSGQIKIYPFNTVSEYSYNFPGLQFPHNEIEFSTNHMGKHVIRLPDQSKYPHESHSLKLNNTNEERPDHYCLLLDHRLERILNVNDR